MYKTVITKIENVRKTQVVRYEIDLPKNIVDLSEYFDDCLENGDLNLGRVVSEDTIEGEVLDEDVSRIEVFNAESKLKIFEKIFLPV